MDTKEVAKISEQTLQALGAVNPTIVVEQVRMIQVIMQDVMREDEHYGKLPGAGKACLFKAGAEKLCFTFQLAPEFVVDERTMDGGHREYSIVCHLSDRSGRRVATGVGSCSTMESKYRYRNTAVKCPKCGKEAIIKGKAEYGGGWVCFNKKGGCGAKFGDNDAAITSQPVGKAENTDLADVWNTTLKMAKKRAHVDATITATACSDIFTQDLEDLPQFTQDATPAPQHPAAQTTAPAATAPAKKAAPVSQRTAQPAKVEEGQFTPAEPAQTSACAGDTYSDQDGANIPDSAHQPAAAALPEGVPATSPTVFKEQVGLCKTLKQYMDPSEHEALRADLNRAANDGDRATILQRIIDGMKGGF